MKCSSTLDKQRNRNRLVVSDIPFSPFLKNWNSFNSCKFFRRGYFFKVNFKSIEENDLYIIVDISNNITVKTIIIYGLVLFQYENSFEFMFTKRKFFMFYQKHCIEVRPFEINFLSW